MRKYVLRVLPSLMLVLLPFVSMGQLSGSYSIDQNGAGASNFKTISNAVTALKTNGVSGNVVFKIAKGTYTERVDIPPISGTSSSSTITFDGTNSDSVTITYSSSASTSRATWHFNGADFVNLKNVTLKSTGTFRSNIHFSDKAEYNVVSECVLEIQGSNTNYRNVVFASDIWAAGNHGNFNTIADTRISGGYYGIFNYGVGLLPNFNNTNNFFINIDIEDVYFYGVYNYYGRNGFYKNVKIEPTYSYGHSFYNYYGIANSIDSCHFKGSGYGFYDNYGKSNSVVNCLIEDQQEHNIYSNYSENARYVRNRLLNPYYYNLYCYGTKKMVLANNRLEGGNRYTYYNWVSYYGEKDSVSANYFTKADHYNLLIYSNKNSIFLNNIIYGRLPGKEYFESNFYLFDSENTKLYHNTFYNGGGGGLYQGANAYAVPNNLFNYSSTKTDVRNNVFDYVGSFKDAANIANYNGSFLNLDFNNYSSKELVFIENTDTFSTLKSWFAAKSNYNKNSYSNVNYFKDTAKGDLHLDENYPRLIGEPIFGIASDYDGNARCTYGPTLGADESTYPVSTLDADFTTSDTVYLGSPYVFLNKNADKIGASHSWWVNGIWDTTSTNFEYKFINAGRHYVRLLTTNCGGVDSITKSVFADTARYKPKADFLLDKTEVDVNEEIALTDLTTNGATNWQWTISPDSIYDPLLSSMVLRATFTKGTDRFSQEPRFEIKYPGVYTIELKAENRIGSSTVVKKDVLIVKGVNQMCQFPNLSTVPSGKLFDQGGSLGDYSNNTNCGFLIDPCANEVKLTFNSFELENGYDFIRIYDGKDNTGTPLWNIAQYGGNGITGNISDAWFDTTFRAQSGKMYIEMSTDPFNVLSGFEAEWTSTPANYSPTKAGFSAPDTVCVDEAIYFENESVGEINEYSWSFGVNRTSVSSTENPRFTYTKPGIWKVEMTANGCSGADTIEKFIVSRFPVARPVSNFIADITRPTKTDVVQLIPHTENCVKKNYWSISPNSGFSFVNKTNDSSYSPQLVFNDTGRYSITLIAENIATRDTFSRLNYIEVVNYCTPTSTNNLEDLGISRVALNGSPSLAKKSASGLTSYSNFTQEATSLEVGYTYTLEIDRPSSNNKIKRSAWIDWNQDGSFSSNELIGEEPNAGTNSLTFELKFKVPTTARNGGTRMRVASNLGWESSFPCGNHLYGEFEDYRINVLHDKTAPIISLVGADTVYANECFAYTDSGVTVCDNINGCGLNFVVSDTVDTSMPGKYLLEYTAKDSNNNWAKPVTRVVMVLEDIMAPNLELLGSDTVFLDVFSSYQEPGVVASDSCNTPLINTIGFINTAILGNYQLSYFATDGKNSSSIKRFIHVVDREAPIISLIGNDTVKVDVFGEYKEQGATYFDNYYKRRDLQVEETNNVNTNEIGSYRATYIAIDPSGNKTNIIIRTVLVLDRTAPEIYLQGPDTVVLEVGSKFQDLLARATDNVDGELGLPSIGGDFYRKFPNARATEIGVYKVQYVFSDSRGNTDSLARTIIVLDTEEPYIRLKGGSIIELCRWDAFVEPGFEVTDNYDKAPTVVKDESNFTSTSLGEYFVTYYAEDQSGNKSEIITRRISVVDCASTLPYLRENDVYSVYPNPTKGLVRITFKKALPHVQSVAICNLQGKEIALKNESDLAESIVFDLHNYSKGLYLLKVKTTDSQFATKLVFE